MLHHTSKRRRLAPIGQAVEWLSLVLALSVILLVVIATLTWWAT